MNERTDIETSPFRLFAIASLPQLFAQNPAQFFHELENDRSSELFLHAWKLVCDDISSTEELPKLILKRRSWEDYELCYFDIPHQNSSGVPVAVCLAVSRTRGISRYFVFNPVESGQLMVCDVIGRRTFPHLGTIRGSSSENERLDLIQYHLTEGPHFAAVQSRPHYEFAHSALPRFMQSNPDSFFRGLLSDSAESWLGIAWFDVCREYSYRAELPPGYAISVRSFRLDTTIAALIVLPPPTFSPEAFVACATLNPDTHRARYFTLEKSIDENSYVGEWIKDAHFNYGKLPESDSPVEAFIEMMKLILDEQLSPQADNKGQIYGGPTLQ